MTNSFNHIVGGISDVTEGEGVVSPISKLIYQYNIETEVFVKKVDRLFWSDFVLIV